MTMHIKLWQQHCTVFLIPKKPCTLAGFEPVISGSVGGLDDHYTTPHFCLIKLKYLMTLALFKSRTWFSLGQLWPKWRMKSTPLKVHLHTRTLNYCRERPKLGTILTVSRDKNSCKHSKIVSQNEFENEACLWRSNKKLHQPVRGWFKGYLHEQCRPCRATKL
jgi:hypothetical protein